MLDGRHTGTGGGNHVTLGGATPADSPLLRRPDLLQSLHHLLAEPSGAVVSVLGHVHRPDQPGAARRRGARRPALRARDRVPADASASTRPASETAQPWLVDRLLRHLLTDLTGNTHRAEFSIDKLYSPDSRDGPARPARIPRVRDAAARADERRADAAAARAGRAFLAAAVSRAASSAGAPRCTTAGCCRISSPPIMRDVVAELERVRLSRSSANGSRRSSSSAFRASAPSTYDGVTIELRQAIEPWHVLGEEVSGTGTARYVDSSVERLQVKVIGHDRRAASRRPATVARCRSTPTGVPGEFVAGVRFRAWSPPSALHPTIGVQAPLVFDLVDTWAAARARRLHVPRRASGRPQLRHVPGQRERGRGAPRRALLGAWPHAGRDEARCRRRRIRRRRRRSTCAGNRTLS